MRRSAALLIALTLVLSLSLRPASPSAAIDLSKLSSPMRALVANGGYKNTKAIAGAVRGLRRGDIYYLATVRGPLDRSLLRGLTRAGARVRVAFPEISTVALVSPFAAIARVAALDHVKRLEVDGVQRLHAASVQYVSAAGAKAWGDQTKRGTADVGADDLWAAGIDGSGVTVGVADSGVDSTHPDLNDLDWRNWGGSHPAKVAFVDCQPSLGDTLTVLNSGAPDVCLPVPGYDDNGHGTHVSGIATGTAQGRGAQNGLYPGMAPGSLLRVAKVCNAGGVCLNSNVMAGMRYLALETSEGGAGADVINMSLGGARFVAAGLGGAEAETNDDPEDQLVNALSQAHNTLFVISAGNSGPVLGSVSNPAAASQSLAVGASVADFDRNHPTVQTLHGEFGNVVPNAAKNGAIGIAAFSSRGPSGDRLVKPDVVAPGVYIVAPEALLGGEVHAGDIGHQNFFSKDPTYAVLSGTSMAAPSASGVAALVWSGYRKAYGASPDYYRLKAALANTAGTKAFEGSVVGLIFGTLVHAGLGKMEDHYPVRNAREVGVTGTGAGRVNAPAALLALTRGVIAYTPKRGALDDIHELQPSWAMDDIAPGGGARATFVLHGAAQMQRSARVTFSMLRDAEPAGMFAAPASWFSLPGSATARRGRDVPVPFGLRVPSKAKPGAYAGTILAHVDLGAVRQTLRIPVQFFVRMLEPNLRGASSIEGPIWASDTTDYSVVGLEDPTADIYTDWTTIPLRVPTGTKRVDFSVYDVAGKDQMDVFIFDSKGHEIDSTISQDPIKWLPGGVTYVSSDKDSPSEVSIIGDSADGADTSDWEDVTLPTTVWIAVSDTSPADPVTMNRFHLDVDVVGAASTGIAGASAPATRAAAQTRAAAAALPATGVGSSQGIALALIAVSGLAVAWLRPRRRRVSP